MDALRSMTTVFRHHTAPACDTTNRDVRDLQTRADLETQAASRDITERKQAAEVSMKAYGYGIVLTLLVVILLASPTLSQGKGKDKGSKVPPRPPAEVEARPPTFLPEERTIIAEFFRSCFMVVDPHDFAVLDDHREVLAALQDPNICQRITPQMER